jgi:uncharacterized protein YjbI with pentapeptide repeats
MKTQNIYRYIYMVGARLDGSDLSYKDFYRADLRHVLLKKSCLFRANLRAANLSYADAEAADFREANMGMVIARETYFNKCDLRKANLSSASLSSADLREADLRGANLVGADLTCADLRGAKMDDVQLWGANLVGAKTDKRYITVCTPQISVIYCPDDKFLWAPAFTGPLHLFEEETKKGLQKVPFAEIAEIADFLKKIFS